MLLEAAEGPELLHASDLTSGAPPGSVLGILGIDTFKDTLLRGAGAVMVMNFPIQPLDSSAEHQLQTSSSFLGPQAGHGPSKDSFVSPDLCPFPWPVQGQPCLLCWLNGSWSHLLRFPHSDSPRQRVGCEMPCGVWKPQARVCSRACVCVHACVYIKQVSTEYRLVALGWPSDCL